MCPVYFLNLQVFKNIHLLFLLVSPMGICHAVDLHQVEIICLKFFPEAINNNICIWTFFIGYTSRTYPDFGAQSVRFPWSTFKCSCSKWMRAITVSTIKKANSFFICLTYY